MMYFDLPGSVAAWTFATAILAVVSFVLIITLLVANAKLRGKLKHWQAIHQTADLNTVYEQTVDKIRNVAGQVVAVTARIDDLEQQMNRKISTAQVKRFNAFSNTGSDLSYAVALLDDTHSGVVLSSIYGREESRTYAKPIFEGDSEYSLTEEEQEVVGRLIPRGAPGR